MNTEPVAWMHKTATSWVSTFIHPETQPEEWIPLYTHPVKELTDEEIVELIISRKQQILDILFEKGLLDDYR